MATLAPLARYIRSVVPAGPDAALLARFVRSVDEAAFAEIVRRHGPAVLGVCRRVLRDGHAAEDAFQATFLLLARKAGSLRRPERLGCWLHGVARRTALKLRGRLVRRLAREGPFDESAFAAPAGPDPDLGAELDAAIQRLPAKYRAAVVLCYLRGLTNAQAAVELGCPANTVATWLARARQRLRGRLLARGMTAAVSAALLDATARNAAALAAGAIGPPTEILALMEGVRSAMMWKKVQFAAAVVAVLTLTGLGATRLAFRATAGPPATNAPPAPSARPETAPPAAEERIPPVDLTTAQASSRNFVVTGMTPEVGHELAKTAEAHRTRLARLWLGRELADWEKPCPIRVTIHANQISFATSFEFSPQFRVSGMVLMGGPQQIRTDMLPHEITHTVLADHFRHPLPRWADEGAASLAESDATQVEHDQKCRQLLNAGKGFRLSYLFGLKDYPSDLMVMYAEAHSIVRFLVDRKDRPIFLKFLSDGLGLSWDKAAEIHYGFKTVNDLETAWIESLRHPRPAPAPALPPPVEPPLPDVVPIQPPRVDEPAPVGEPVLPLDERRPAVPVGKPVLPLAPSEPLPVAPASVPAARGGGMDVVQVSMDKDGMVVCRFNKVFSYHPITTYRTTDKGEVQQTINYVRRTVQEDRSYRPEHLEVIGSDGKRVDAKDLSVRLAKETLALFAGEGPFEEQLLPVLKEGTLLIRLATRPPALPPPSLGTVK